MEIHRMDVTIPYYDDMSRISNSNIGWFLNKGPAYLHNMLIGKEEGETGAQLEKGTMCHSYILRPEDFNNEYLLSVATRPSSSQQTKFCEELINSVELEPDKAILKAYEASYSIVGKTTADRLSKGKEIASTLKDYIQALKDAKESNKIIINQSDINLVTNMMNSIKSHKYAYKLLYPDDPNEKWFHEFQINWEHETECCILLKGGYSKDNTIKCKSLLDHISFNEEEHTCTIVDLKTTVHVENFELSVKQYDYFRQIEYYREAAEWYIKNILKEDINDWYISCYIVAVDSIKGNCCRVFRVELGHLRPKQKIINTTLNDIRFHQINNIWVHHRKYYEGDGDEYLDIEYDG